MRLEEGAHVARFTSVDPDAEAEDRADTAESAESEAPAEDSTAQEAETTPSEE
jgi:hypothetical protein